VINLTENTKMERDGEWLQPNLAVQRLELLLRYSSNLDPD